MDLQRQPDNQAAITVIEGILWMSSCCETFGASNNGAIEGRHQQLLKRILIESAYGRPVGAQSTLDKECRSLKHLTLR